MRCAFCGREFTEEEAIQACKGCPISTCQRIRCPHCGYEALLEPKLIKRLKGWFKKRP